MDTEPDSAAPSVAFEQRIVPLDEHTQLVVRKLGEADLAALEALYESLSDEDRRLRFFSAFRPSEKFLRRWVNGGGRGGQVLGAFVQAAGAAPNEAEELVGEAGYAVLDNGNGELGITIADQWRGWLGAYLLDVLAEAAHQAGIDNIEADIRLDNRAMLAVVRRRGTATVEQPEYSQVRLVMGTGSNVPGWPSRRDPSRVRVLVESPAARWSGRAESAEVLACPGPHGRPGGHCPLLDGGRCPLLEGADAVVVVTGDRRDGSFEKLAQIHGDAADGKPVEVCGLSSAVGELVRRIAAAQPTRRSST